MTTMGMYFVILEAILTAKVVLDTFLTEKLCRLSTQILQITPMKTVGWEMCSASHTFPVETQRTSLTADLGL